MNRVAGRRGGPELRHRNVYILDSAAFSMKGLLPSLNIEAVMAALPIRRIRDPPADQPPGPLIYAHIGAVDDSKHYFVAYRTVDGDALGYHVDQRIPLAWVQFIPAGVLGDPRHPNPLYRIDPSWSPSQAFSIPYIQRAWRRSGRTLRSLLDCIGN